MSESPVQSTPSLFGGMAVIIYQTLNSYGVDANAVFERLEIDHTNLNSAYSRIHTSHYYKLLVEAEKETNDPYFIFRTADHIQPTLFHAMGLALFSSRSIRKFLIRLERYGAFLTTTEDWVFDDKEFEPALVITPNQDKAHQISVLLYGTLIWFKKMISLMYGEHFKPAAVKIPGTESDPMMIEKLQEYFDCPIIFGAEEYSLVFNAEDLDVQLPTANASLARQNDEVILEVMERIAKANTAMRVRLKLMELLPTGEFCKATVARELCFSVRTLHNKLAEVEETPASKKF